MSFEYFPTNISDWGASAVKSCTENFVFTPKSEAFDWIALCLLDAAEENDLPQHVFVGARYLDGP